MNTAFQKVLIATDLSEADDYLLTLVRQLSERVPVKEVHLAHVIPNILVPSTTEIEFHQMSNLSYPIEEKIKDVLTGKTLELLHEANFKVEMEIVEGTAYRELLKLLETQSFDLLVVGNKKKSEGSGITARRIARKAPSNVLFVPDREIPALKNILVAVDFSENSARALQTALDLSRGEIPVTVLYVIRTLQTDQYYGLTLTSRFRDSLMEDAWKAYDKFITKYNFSKARIKPEVVINDYNNVASQLKDYLRNHEFEMVILGAKGHSMFENFLYGSVTESFLSTYHDEAVLVIR